MSRKTRTLRGQITTVGGKADKQLILNDQLINRGMRVTGFFVWPEVYGAPAICNAILSYAQFPSDENMDSSDNRQIGWNFYECSAGIPPTSGAGYSPVTRIIDPDHIINRDLFVSLRGSTNQTWNYLVVTEGLTLTDSEAIITIIKENSQSIEPFQ